jgi:hypothetical protein
VPIILFALLLFVLLALAGVILLSLALRYRAGTARRQARRWVAKLNVWMTSLSVVFFLSFTFLLSFWVGLAFRYALIGMGIGGILGLLGLALTRWENRPEALSILRAAGSRFSLYSQSQHVLCTAGGTPRTPAAALPSISIG